MDGSARPSSHRRLALGAVGSTNTVALQAARAGDPGDLWVTAETQSDGRGRRGRRWESGAGNLYASLLLLDPAPVQALANLPLVAALGVRNAIATVSGRAGGPDPTLKWPNDVLLNGRKAVGILLESEAATDGRLAVAIGCGVNVSRAPTNTAYPATSLVAEGLATDIETVFAALTDAMAEALMLFDRGEGFPAIRRQWLSHAVGIGEPCRVNLADRVIEGRFAALADDGRLVLERPDGSRELIAAGDLFFDLTGPGIAGGRAGH